MTRLYQDVDLWNAYKQRKRILSGFFIATGLFLAGFFAVFIYFLMLPYEDPNGTWATALACVLTALYIVFLFPYVGICLRRSCAYYKMLRFVSVGLKEYMTAPFAGVEDWTTVDGVDVNVATFRVHNHKRDEDMIRQIYVDGEKEFPPFEEGQSVRVVSQGNLLISYEILA